MPAVRGPAMDARAYLLVSNLLAKNLDIFDASEHKVRSSRKTNDTFF